MARSDLNNEFWIVSCAQSVHCTVKFIVTSDYVYDMALVLTQ